MRLLIETMQYHPIIVPISSSTDSTKSNESVKSPTTGDTTNIPLYATMVAALIGGLVLVAGKRRKF